MKRLQVWFCLGLLLLAGGLAFGDGEPSAETSDSGMIVPVQEAHVSVLDQHITITLPSPNQRDAKGYEMPAVIRAEYILSTDTPLNLQVAWPSSGIRYYYRDKDYKIRVPGAAYLPAIKFDGKPVAAEFLNFDRLADQYVQPWLAQIDKLLEAKPELKEQVDRLRKEGDGLYKIHALEQTTADGEKVTRLCNDAAGWLGYWMQDHGYLKTEHEQMRAEYLAGGLLGIVPGGYGNRRDECVQSALRWLDPSYQPINVYKILAERWSQDTRLLNPYNGQLYDTREGMLPGDDPTFAIFRFPITLQPGKKHKLIVQYGQFLGGAFYRSNRDWAGLVYLMEPAKQWGRWGKTTIEIRVPKAWRTVAIRPQAKKVATKDNISVYQIEMGRPRENLYISVSQNR